MALISTATAKNAVVSETIVSVYNICFYNFMRKEISYISKNLNDKQLFKIVREVIFTFVHPTYSIAALSNALTARVASARTARRTRTMTPRSLSLRRGSGHRHRQTLTTGLVRSSPYVRLVVGLRRRVDTP